MYKTSKLLDKTSFKSKILIKGLSLLKLNPKNPEDEYTLFIVQDALNWLERNKHRLPEDDRIEIRFVTRFHKTLKPAVFVSYIPGKISASLNIKRETQISSVRKIHNSMSLIYSKMIEYESKKARVPEIKSKITSIINNFLKIKMV